MDDDLPRDVDVSALDTIGLFAGIFVLATVLTAYKAFYFVAFAPWTVPAYLKWRREQRRRPRGRGTVRPGVPLA